MDEVSLVNDGLVYSFLVEYANSLRKLSMEVLSNYVPSYFFP